MATGNKQNLAPIPTVNMTVPAEGPESTFLGVFSMPSSTTLNLNSMETGTKVRAPQTLFFDASASTGPVTLTFAGTGQTLVLPPEKAGYVPILTPNEVGLTISGAGGGVIGLWLISVPLPAQVWDTSAGGATSVTAAQGLPNTDANAWPVKIVMAGFEIGTANPLPIIAPEDITVTFDGTQPVNIVGTVPVSIAATVAVSNATEAATIAAGAGTVASPASAVQVGAKVLAALPTYTTARFAGLTMGIDGQLYVNDTLLNTLLNHLTIDNVAPAAASATFSFNVGATYNNAPSEWTNGQQGGLTVNPYGALNVSQEGIIPTYFAGFQNTLAVTAGTICAIEFASAQVRVKKIIWSLNGNVVGNCQVALRKYLIGTAWAGGGVSSFANKVPFDSADPPATASILTFTGTVTAAPTIVGTVRLQTVALPASGTQSTTVEWDFSNTGSKGPVLRSGDAYAFDIIGSTTVASINYEVCIEWEEV